MIRVDGKVTIVGDIHGQFYDFHQMLGKLHKPKSKSEKMLFLGDYVDRGAWGPQLMLMMLILKVNTPQNILLLRGNHETREITEMFNFRDQVLEIYDEQVYECFCQVFDLLPIAAVVNGQYLCMHGGISEEVKSLSSINSIDRKMEPPEYECLLSDLLWADPQSNKSTDIDFEYNDKRKISVIFGKRPVNNLL